jgi:hypothetical protein
MKSGTAEHEQKGVTTPRSAARTFPTDSRFPARMARVRSGVKKDRTMIGRRAFAAGLLGEDHILAGSAH